MKTIMLMDKMPGGVGGRPMKLGSYVSEDNESYSGHFGIFLGYLPDYQCKVIISSTMLEKCIGQIGATYKIKVDVVKASQPLNFSKMFLRLIPQGIKKEMVKGLIGTVDLL